MDHTDEDQLHNENARLKRELDELQQRRNQEVQQYEQQLEREKNTGRHFQEQVSQRSHEIESMRGRLVKLTRQLDEEVTRRDQAQTELHTLERKMENLNEPSGSQQSPAGSHPRGKGISFEREKGQQDDNAMEKGASTHASMKLMRVIDEWMRVRDLQQAMLRNASINDACFATLVQVLGDCQSLQTLDLAQNMLTMDSCSDLCQLITNTPHLSFISLAENLFSLRSVGYFMTAVMERQNFERTSSKKLNPLDLLDLHGNEGLVASFKAPPPEHLLQQINTGLGATKLPPYGVELTAHVARALWQFLHDTGHPQVRSSDVRNVEFQLMDQTTVRKMETALMKILLLSAEDPGHMEVTLAPTSSGVRSVTADLVFLLLRDAPEGGDQVSPDRSKQESTSSRNRDAKDSSVHLPPIDQRTQSQADKGRGARQDGLQASRPELRDPFSDLKTAFEPPKEKLKTFNLKQIVTRTDVVLMNMLERLLETTEIDARDVETEMTLLEFACTKGNLGLAKLCYRRGADLSQRTTRGDTAFNIVTRNRRYDIMELLHTYGVKVNSADSEGKTALHIAAANDDVDAVCRLLEWGADVNIKDKKKRTPLHLAAAGGNAAVTMLLLEVGAELNAKDEKEYTAVAHAEAKNHFGLMDRLVQLGGKGHGLQVKGGEMVKSKSAKTLGDLNVSAGMLKSSSLGRIGKVRVGGMPPPIKPAPLQK